MRKKKLFWMVCFIAMYAGVCMAQDVIITREAKRINAWVFEVGAKEVRYKSFDNQDGPTYTVAKSEIASIKYQNGKIDTFEDVIVTRDAKKIKVLVSVVGEEGVKYKSVDNPAGPGYTLAKSEIESITYQDGEVVTFEEEEKTPLVVDYQETIRDNPVLYQKYLKGKKKSRAGTILTIVGGGLAIGGIAYAATAQYADDTSYVVGSFSAVAGGCLVGIGIPTMIVGSSKKRSALREYEQTLSEIPVKDTPHFQLNLHGNGVGLAFVF